MAKELIVLVGPPCSGKSTLAVDYVAQGYVYVNQDTQAGGHRPRFVAAVKRGDNVIVDRMGFSKDQRARYLDPAKAAGYSTRIIVLPIPTFEECLARCLARTGHPTIKNEENARAALSTFFSGYEAPVPMEADAIIFKP